MKKIRTKKGFTLLEVLLAVVIMVIASTMIMKGFIGVMVFAKNNSKYAKDSAIARRAAEAEVVRYATSSNQMDAIRALYENGSSSTLTLSYDTEKYGDYAGSITLPELTVDVTGIRGGDSIFNEEDGNVLEIDGQTIDSHTNSTNRFTFFYDFGAFIGEAGMNNDHVIRWGFILSDQRPRAHSDYLNAPTGYTCIYCDKNGNGLVGRDDEDNVEREFIGYGQYGWYCFNANHVNADGSPMTCRNTPYTPVGG